MLLDGDGQNFVDCLRGHFEVFAKSFPFWTKCFPSPRSDVWKIMANSLIQSDASILMGKPVVAGTRVTVELILEKLAAGETIEQLLQAHPHLTAEAVLAALEFAAQSGHGTTVTAPN